MALGEATQCCTVPICFFSNECSPEDELFDMVIGKLEEIIMGVVLVCLSGCLVVSWPPCRVKERMITLIS